MMKRWILFALFVVAPMSATAASAPVDQPITYAGIDDDFYQDQYRALRAVTERALPAAINTVLKSDVFANGLGITSAYRLRYPMRIEIRVVPEESLYHGLEGTAGWEQNDGHWVHVLTLNIASYIQHPEEDIPAVVTHEYAHILLADAMGFDALMKVPSWLNEGIAQSVTNEGRDRVKDLSRGLRGQESMLRTCGLDAPVDEFAHGEGNYECYPEYYLAMRWMSRLGGPSTIGRTLKALEDSHTFADAFEKVTGKDYSQFQSDVDSYMMRVVSRQAPIP